jgi:ATF/CREB family transcription factor
LTSALVASREEISRLSALVGGAGVGPGTSLLPVGVGAQPVSMNVSLPGKGGQAAGPPGQQQQTTAATAGGGGGRGYGY